MQILVRNQHQAKKLNKDMLLIAVIVLIALYIYWRSKPPSVAAKYNSLKDKVVLITGASSGIGKACCFAFQKYGCRVVLCARSLNVLEEVRQQLQEEPGNKHKHLAFKLDVTDEKNAGNVVRDIAAACGNRIDILVNNAGGSQRGGVLTTTVDVFRRILEVNYFGNVIVAKSVLPFMVAQQSGHIVGIGSIQSKVAIPFRASYSSSKHACQAFYDSLRPEIHQHNIDVTTINPGYVKTNTAKNALKGDGTKYDKGDADIDNGMDPSYVAEQIVNAVVSKRKDVPVAKIFHRGAIWLRYFTPDLYFFVIRKRAGV